MVKCVMIAGSKWVGHGGSGGGVVGVINFFVTYPGAGGAKISGETGWS